MADAAKTPEELQEEVIKELEAQGNAPQGEEDPPATSEAPQGEADAGKKEPEGSPSAPPASEAPQGEADKKDKAANPDKDTIIADQELAIAGHLDEIKKLKASLAEVEAALDLRLKEDLDSLSAEDKALVEELAEGNALEKSKVLTRLLKAGKIAKAHSPSQDARAGQRTPVATPKTPEEAAQQVMKAIEARSL